MHRASKEDTYATVRQSHRDREWAAFEPAVPTHIYTCTDTFSAYHQDRKLGC